MDTRPTHQMDHWQLVAEVNDLRALVRLLRAENEMLRARIGPRWWHRFRTRAWLRKFYNEVRACVARESESEDA